MVHFYPRLWFLPQKQVKALASKPSILNHPDQAVDDATQVEELEAGRSQDAIHQLSKTYSLERRTFL